MNLSVLVPVLVAIIAPLGAYLLAARKMSGKVNTSDADQLWREAGSIRDDYRERLRISNERQTSLEERVARLEGQNTALVQENFDLKRKVNELESLVRAQQTTIAALEAIIKSKNR
jgi:chromosome segregation ATPase